MKIDGIEGLLPLVKLKNIMICSTTTTTLFFTLSFLIFYAIELSEQSKSKSKGETNYTRHVPSFMTDLKVLLMHYADSFLRGGKLLNVPLEGLFTSEVIPSISNHLSEMSKSLNDPVLAKFSANIRKKMDVTSWAKLIWDQKASYFSSRYTTPLQKRIFDDLNVGEYSLFPLAILHHQILIVIEKTSLTTFRLVVINSGNGLQYHHGRSDPNGVYPMLFRAWLIYDNIPLTKFTEGKNWFFRVIGILDDEDFMTQLLARNQGSAIDYFYGSILGIFNEFRRIDNDVNDDDDRFIRMQLSGSCVYSSFLAGILYFSSKNCEFLRRRFIFGIHLLNIFIDRWRNDSDLIAGLSDPYDPTTRYYFKRLISGIAVQVNEYIEVEIL